MINRLKYDVLQLGDPNPNLQWLCETIEDGDIELVPDAQGETLQFDTTTPEYTKIVETVKMKMINCGEGAALLPGWGDAA